MLQCPISERLHYWTYIGALIFLPVEDMLQQSLAMSQRSLGGNICLFLCLCLFLPFSCKHKRLKWNFLQFWFLDSHCPPSSLRSKFTLNDCPLPSPLCPLSVFLSGEPVPECRRYVQVRNITKGDCRLDNVEVSFCRGRCLSRTDVILEVRKKRDTSHSQWDITVWMLNCVDFLASTWDSL